MNDDLILLPPAQRLETPAEPDRSTGRIRRTKGPRQSRSRVIRRSLTLVAVALVFLIGWVGIRGGMAAAAVMEGAGAATRLSPLLLAQDGAGARTEIEQIERTAAKARSLTSDPVWRTVEFAPYLGSNLTTVREGIATLDLVATEALDPVTELATTVKVTSLKTSSRTERLASLALAAPSLEKIDRALAAAAQQAAAVDVSRNIDPLAEGFEQIRGSVNRYAAAAAGLRDLSDLVPSLTAAAPAGSWTITITNAGTDGTAQPVAYLTAFTSGSEFRVDQTLGASEGTAPIGATLGTLTVDVATLELLTERFGTVTVPGVGDLAAAQVSDFATTGAYAQAPSFAEAERNIGTFAATVISRLVD